MRQEARISRIMAKRSIKIYVLVIEKLLEEQQLSRLETLSIIQENADVFWGCYNDKCSVQCIHTVCPVYIHGMYSVQCKNTCAVCSVYTRYVQCAVYTHPMCSVQ